MQTTNIADFQETLQGVKGIAFPLGIHAGGHYTISCVALPSFPNPFSFNPKKKLEAILEEISGFLLVIQLSTCIMDKWIDFGRYGNLPFL